MNKLNIVMYHYIRDLAHSRYPQIKGLDINLFRQQIEFLKSHFSVITMEEAIFAGGVIKYQIILFCLPLMMVILTTIHLPFLFWKRQGCRGLFLFQEKLLQPITF